MDKNQDMALLIGWAFGALVVVHRQARKIDTELANDLFEIVELMRLEIDKIFYKKDDLL